MNFLETPVIPMRIGISQRAQQKGITKIAGLLRYEDGNILLEFRITNNKMKVTSPKTVAIHIEDLRGVELKKGLFRTKLRLKVNKLDVLDPFPFITKDSLLVWAWKREHNQFEHLLSRINIDRSESMWG